MKTRMTPPRGVSRHTYANHLRHNARLRIMLREEANRLARWRGPVPVKCIVCETEVEE